MARLLVTGASGLLGANLVLEAMARHHVAAASLTHPVALGGVDAYQADLCDRRSSQALLAEAAPEWVVHCAAATDLDACERDPAMAQRLNRDMAQFVAAAAAERGARMVLVSTDAVFDGRSGGYDESAPTNPLGAYGRSKLDGERAVRQAHPDAIIVRTNIFGWNAQAKQSLAEWFLGRCRCGQRCPGWTDVWSTPILVNDLAEIILALLEAGRPGCYHVGGGTCLSKYDFGRKVAATFGLDPGLIEPAEVSSAGLAAPRAQRVCLQGRRIEAELGVQLPSIDDGLTHFRRLQEDGTLERLKTMLMVEVPAPRPSGGGGTGP